MSILFLMVSACSKNHYVAGPAAPHMPEVGDANPVTVPDIPSDDPMASEDGGVILDNTKPTPVPTLPPGVTPTRVPTAVPTLPPGVLPTATMTPAPAGACNPSVKKNVLTFEDLAVGHIITATDNAAFNSTYGVQFKYNNAGESFRVAEITRHHTYGPNPEPSFPAWRSGLCPDDPTFNRLCSAAAEARGGYRALSTTDARSSNTINFTITYAWPVKDLSFDLYDVDGSEDWSVTAKDAAGMSLQNKDIDKGVPRSTGNGGTSVVKFSSSSANIRSVTVVGIKKNKHFGFGFDNFNTGIPLCTP